MKYIIDLDGTIMDGDKPNLDSVEFITELQKRSIKFIVMTNSIKSPEIISKRLEHVGINVDSDNIFNPINAINSYIVNNGFKSAYIIGSPLEIDQVKINKDKDNPEVVILLDFERENIGFNTLQNVYELINKNVPVIAASKSLYYLKDNKQILDTGAFVSLFECVCNTEIKVLGKPSIEYFEAGVLKLESMASEITVIGDDWSTDIMGAKSIGCQSVLLKSGKYKKGDELNCYPSKFIASLMQLLE